MMRLLGVSILVSSVFPTEVSLADRIIPVLSQRAKRNAPFERLRGGNSATVTTNDKPDWLDIDRETLQKYMSLASQRHKESIKAACDAYWSSSGGNQEFDDLSHIDFDTYGIENNPSTAWSLPDFSSDLDTSRMIFVTRGASSSSRNESSTSSGSASPLFSPEECNSVIQIAEAHFEDRNGWTTLPSGQYDVAGFWIKDIPAVHEWFNNMVKRRLFQVLLQKFPDFVSSIDDLCVDNAYLFKYTPETGRRTGVHTDSGCLSFTIAMNGPDNYSGGGTWFEGLESGGEKVPASKLEMGQGHVTIRPAGLRHCGHAVTEGTQYIIGGFCMHRNKVEYARMLIGLGADLAAQGKYKQSQEALEASISINSNFDGAYTHLSNALQKQGKTEKAKEVLEHCFYHVNRNNGEVAYSLGVMYLDDKKLKEAKNCLEACVEVDDLDYGAMSALAQVYSSEGDTAGEQGWHERIVNTPGVDKVSAASAYCNLGVLHEGKEEELQFYQKALELAPDNFQSRFSLASAYASRQDWTRAADSFRSAVNLATDDPETQRKALSALYRVAVSIVQAKQATSQSEQMELLLDAMGADNYELLAATAGRA